MRPPRRSGPYLEAHGAEDLVLRVLDQLAEPARLEEALVPRFDQGVVVVDHMLGWVDRYLRVLSTRSEAAESNPFGAAACSLGACTRRQPPLPLGE